MIHSLGSVPSCFSFPVSERLREREKSVCVCGFPRVYFLEQHLFFHAAFYSCTRTYFSATHLFFYATLRLYIYAVFVSRHLVLLLSYLNVLHIMFIQLVLKSLSSCFGEAYMINHLLIYSDIICLHIVLPRSYLELLHNPFCFSQLLFFCLVLFRIYIFMGFLL